VVAEQVELLRVEVPPGRGQGVPVLGDPKMHAKRRTISTSRGPRRGRRWGSYGRWQSGMERAVTPRSSVAVDARAGADWWPGWRKPPAARRPGAGEKESGGCDAGEGVPVVGGDRVAADPASGDGWVAGGGRRELGIGRGNEAARE
jgi:hypothetical protein